MGRDQREDRAHQAMRVALYFRRGVLIFRNIHRRQLRHIDSAPRLEDVSQGNPQHDRHRGDHFKIDNGLRADTAQLLRIAHARNTDHQGRDDDRYDDHFNQMDKDIARRGQQV